MTNGLVAPFKSDFWLRTGTTNDESVAQYFIAGLFIGDTNNRANPNPANITAAWEIWDGVNGVWNYLPVPITAGWNDLRVTLHNGSVQYYLSTNLVYSETNIAFPDHLQLTTVSLEAYNFGNNAYAATWGSDWCGSLSATFGQCDERGRQAGSADRHRPVRQPHQQAGTVSVPHV